MKNLPKFLGKLLGFSRTRSLLGKHAQKVLKEHKVRHGLSVTIIALATATFLVHNLANIGGPLAVNAVALNAPKVEIDAQTLPSIQSPIAYEYESRGFSWYHAGADLVAPTGTPVKPIMEGTVEATPYDPIGYGIHVILAHSEGYESIYGHLSQVEVKVGQKVNLNTELGKSGSTGFSTGPHLHLEIHQNGTAINPAEIVPGIQ